MIISGTRLVGGTYGTSPIVQTGLMQWYDAQSYTAGGLWPAKTGYDAQLVNAPAYTSSSPTYFNFNQSSLQFAFTNNIGDLTNWTIESWFRPQADLTADGNEGLKAILTTVYDDEMVKKAIKFIGLGLNSKMAKNFLIREFHTLGTGEWEKMSRYMNENNIWVRDQYYLSNLLHYSLSTSRGGNNTNNV